MEKEKKLDRNKFTLEEILYFAFFILLSVTKGLGFYEWQKLFILLIIPAFFFGLLKILMTKYTKRQWALQIILLLLTGIVFYESGEVGILFVMLTILGMKGISVDKVFRLGLWVWTICAIVLSIFSFFRLEHTVYRVSDKMGLGYIFRWSLGFTHPNVLHTTYLALCVLILYELGQRYRFRHFLLLMLGNALVFFYSISYTGFGIVTLLLVGGLYVRFRPRFCLFEKIVVNLVLPAIIFISFGLPLMLFGSSLSKIAQALNFLVNTRIYVAYCFLTPECISPFGVRMSYLSQIQPYLSIDNSYIWAFIHYGIILFVLLILAYFALIVDYTRKQKTRELVLIICLLGAGLTEPLLFNTSFKNVTLLFLGGLLFRQKENEAEYYLFPKWNRKLEELTSSLLTKLPIKIWQLTEIPSRLGIVWKAYHKRILTGIAAGAILGIMLCSICYTQPKGYIVPRRTTDWREKESVYLESAKEPAYTEYRIMNYQDADTPMQIVEGRAVTLETVRYYAGSMLIGGLTGYLFCAGALIRKDRKNEREED